MRNNAIATLLGLAIGDAVGATLEFKVRDTLPPVLDMEGGGVHELNPGEWTDDTSMALCLGYSLLEKGFDPEDQLSRYWKWYQHGYCSSKDHCFDIGITTREALVKYRQRGLLKAVYSEHSAGNGALMRLAPISIYYRCPNDNLDSLKSLISYAKQSSLTTHNNEMSTDACAYFALLLNKAINNTPKDKIIETSEAEAFILKLQSKPIRDIMNNKRFLTAERREIKSSGFVVHSLEAALWAFYQTDNFKDAILLATNLADDSDTVAAICGMIAGAHYGIDNIPPDWLRKLYDYKKILMLSYDLYKKKPKTN